MLMFRAVTPPSPLNNAINRILKACQIGIRSAAILEKEVRDLHALNVKQKCKAEAKAYTV